MRVVLQRVSKASVTIDDTIHSQINRGFLILLGITEGDQQEDIDWLVSKIVKMRLFPDSDNKMNLSLQDVDGDLLIVSQFTLHAGTKKGNRPSFTKAAKPDIAIPLYQQFLATAEKALEKPCKSGQFGADMQINLLNDGPVTIIVDSHMRE